VIFSVLVVLLFFGLAALLKMPLGLRPMAGGSM